MSILGWIVFGLITGFVASRIVNSRGEGCILNIVLGLVGALVGGFIFRQLAGFDYFTSISSRCSSRSSVQSSCS